MRLSKLVVGVLLLAAAALIVPVALGAKAQHAVKPATAQSVALQGHQFTPASVTVHVGETVTWTNNSGQSHTVTSTDGTTFDSGNFDSGARPFTHTFTKTGTFYYYCQYHGAAPVVGGPGTGMSGTVIVN